MLGARTAGEVGMVALRADVKLIFACKLDELELVIEERSRSLQEIWYPAGSGGEADL